MNNEIRKIIENLKPNNRRSMKRLYYDRVFDKWIYVWRKSEPDWMRRLKNPAWYVGILDYILNTITQTKLVYRRRQRTFKYNHFGLEKYEKKIVPFKDQILPR